MPLSNTEINRLADNIVASALTCRAHSGDPGANGTNNRIGTASAALAAANWSNAVNGDVTYNAAANFGVLDAGSAQTVSYYVIFRGTAYVSDGAINPPVAVTAGGTFSIDTGTIVLNGDNT